MEWIKCSERKPTPADSPILAIAIADSDRFSTQALTYLVGGWDGPGWYDLNEEYGMSLNIEEAHYCEYNSMIYWMPLPQPPKEE